MDLLIKKGVVAVLAATALMAMTALTASTINHIEAQLGNVTTPGNVTKFQNLGVGVSLFGLNDADDDIITFTTLKNGTQTVTKVDLSSARQLLQKKNETGVSSVFFLFTNVEISTGDEIKACALTVTDLNLICNKVLKTPGPGEGIQLRMSASK